MEKFIIPNIKVRNTTRTNMVIGLRMVFHAAGLVFRGSLLLRNYFRYLRRLLLFLQKMKGNKYIKLPSGIKINLYVPAFPTKAFFRATHKMLEFENKMPAITALVSVTSACRYDCEHCYQKKDKGKDADLGKLRQAVAFFRDEGVAFFNIEGGEPFLVFPRLKAVCETIGDASEVLINSTGDRITTERLRELKNICNLVGIMFSLHTHEKEKLNKFMNHEEAWSNLHYGVRCCHQAGVPVMFNSCLPRESYFNGDFDRVVHLAEEMGGSLIQLIKPKNAGGWLLEGGDHFSQADLDEIRRRVIRYNTGKRHRSAPFIAAMIIDEDAEHFGCTAGGTDRFYLNAKGDLQPCEFLNISFGNIMEEPVEIIYKRMRDSFAKPGCTWLCERYNGKIAGEFRKMESPVLPLPPESTLRIINTEDHGKVPEFYDRASKI